MSRVVTSPRSAQGPDLWALALDQPQIDPSDLCVAIERELGRGEPDFRTRLLVRDALTALGRVLGAPRLDAWIEKSPLGAEIHAIARAELGAPGFPSLAERLMESTKAETVLQYLRELGQAVTRPTRVAMGGSVALILGANLSRHTEDIDVVDEVPAEIRSQHELLDGLARRYGLRIAHFQSHYLPAEWEKRTRSLGRFGRLDVDLVDPYDIAVSKLTSNREKDRDDLRVVMRELDKKVLTSRLRTAAGALLAQPALRQNAVANWYVIYGESLPE